jgi:hypothetical protein
MLNGSGISDAQNEGAAAVIGITGIIGKVCQDRQEFRRSRIALLKKALLAREGEAPAEPHACK